MREKKIFNPFKAKAIKSTEKRKKINLVGKYELYVMKNNFPVWTLC